MSEHRQNRSGVQATTVTKQPQSWLVTAAASSVTALALLPYVLDNIRYLVIGTDLYWLEASPRLRLPSGEEIVQLITLGGGDHGGHLIVLLMLPGFHFSEATPPCPQGFRGTWKVRTYPGDRILWWKGCALCLGLNLLIWGLGQFG